jgi:hypothetical protein
MTAIQIGDDSEQSEGGPIERERNMSLPDARRHQRSRLALYLGATVVAMLALATPASASGASAPPAASRMVDPVATAGLAQRDAHGGRPGEADGGAFVYRDGDLRALRPVPGAEVSLHVGINNRGQTVGSYVDDDTVLGPEGYYPPDAVHGFVQDRRGRVIRIDVPGGDNEFPEGGINSRGAVAGVYVDAGVAPDPDGVFPPRGSVHGFIRDPRGRITSFDVPAPRMHAVTDINDRGQVVGYVDESFTSGSGFLRDPDGTVTRVVVPGASYTEPRGVTNRGQVVGSYQVGDRNPDGSIAPGRVHGFIWDDGRITSFDVPGSTLTVPTHVNDRGDISGGYRDADGRQHGFLLRRGRYTTIDAPGRTDTIAWGLNDRGDLVIPEAIVSIGQVSAAPADRQPDARGLSSTRPGNTRAR